MGGNKSGGRSGMAEVGVMSGLRSENVEEVGQVKGRKGERN